MQARQKLGIASKSEAARGSSLGLQVPAGRAEIRWDLQFGDFEKERWLSNLKSSSVRLKNAEATALTILMDWFFLFAGKTRFSSFAKGIDAFFKV